jgi:hypothetical protein
MLVAAIVCAAFVNKPFTIDDQTFLAMSEHMLHDPLHPASVLMVNNGRPADWISNGMWSGPVAPALMMPAVAAGGAEWLAHLTMLAMFWIGLVATAALALRLGVSETGARWATLLVATSPAVIAMSMTEMPDIPAMAFATLGVERLIAYGTQRGLVRLISAALLFLLGTLARQHGILVFGCGLVMLVPRWPATWSEVRVLARDRTLHTAVIALIATVLALVLVYHVMEDEHHGSLAATTVNVSDTSLWRVNLANLPAQWVLTFPLGLAWLALHARRLVRSWWCWIGALVGAYLAWQTQIVYRNESWLWWQVPITALGTMVLFDLVASAFRRCDTVELAAGTWLFVALPMVTYSHLPPKYLVMSAPAMALLLVRHAARDPSWRWRRYVIGAIMTAGVALGVLIVQADARMGEIGREGGELVAAYVQRGERVWFDGTWGFQWYAEHAGGQPMSSEGLQPQPGDVVVAGQEARLVRPWRNKQLLERRTFDDPGGRVIARPAGFFSNVAWGPLPWVWGHKPLSPIEAWRILP